MTSSTGGIGSEVSGYGHLITISSPISALAVTVLGSGGPVANPRRASSSYLLWIDGRPRGLIDAGGGAFVRLGELGVSPSELDFYLLTHTHIDHTGGLAPVIFGAWIAGRSTSVTIVGPTGRNEHPGCHRFCELLFGDSGAWAYLHSFDGFALDVREAPHDATHPVPILELGGVSVHSIGVPHGMMPSIAYRIDYAGRSVVFSGDLEGRFGPLIELATNCDLLVHDQALPRRDMANGHLHPPPAETGANAARAGARSLVLSHFLPPAEESMESITAAVRAEYSGEVIVAADRLTIELTEAGAVLR